MRKLTALQTIGVLLIVGGALYIVERLGILSNGASPLITGALVLILYIRVRLVSLITLSAILLALGSARAIEPPAVFAEMAWLLTWLGAAFMVVFLVHTRSYGNRYRWWPLLSAGVLWLVAGVAVLEAAGLLPAQAATALSFLWPAALIAGGVWLMLAGVRKR